MASIEFIQKRIEGKEKEIEKLEKKLVRIRKAESYSWDDDHNPYYYNERDLKWCLRDIEAAKKSLEEYKAKLAAESEKANSRDVKVIIDFLNDWKNLNREFYKERFEKYLIAREEYLRKDKEYCDWHNNGGWADPNYKEITKANRAMVKRFREKWNFLAPYTARKNCKLVLDIEKLNKELDQEANRKYDFIIERTNAIVGTITDASNLEIGEKGDLNGYIIGTKGQAKVQTIGAGGYNIQCFHFRTLINKVN